MAKKNIYDSIDNIESELYHETLKKSRVDKQMGTSFTPRQTNMSRFLTYGSRTYGELGFDPTRDNDAYYNSKTSGLDDFARGIEGSFKLAKVGFNDTFAFGVLKNKTSSFEFENIMNDYSSTRGGFSGFMSNTMLSSGYTAGIMAAIAAEEIMLTGITALTAGAGGALQVGETAAVVGRGANALDNARQFNSTLGRVRAASDINTARTLYQKVGKGLGSTFKPLNPLDNTIDFIKDFKNIKDYSKVVVGAGALVRDMRKLYMTHSESKLEAEMAEREFFNKEYEKAQKESENGSVEKEVLKDIENRSKHVYSQVYTGNLGLIYATNAIGFDNMFKTMKGVTKGNSVLDNGLFRKVINKETNQVTWEAIENPLRGVRKHLFDQKKNFTTWRGLSQTVLSASMEGVQELGQDILSTSSKEYFTNAKNVEQLKGGILSQAFDDILRYGDSEFQEAIGEGAKEMMSWKGLETFMSGALMGAFAAPVGLATKATNSFLFEGGFKDMASQINNREEFKAAKEKDFKSRQAKAKVLTEFYNRSKNFVDFVENPVMVQEALQEEMMQAAREGNTFEFKNAQEKSFAEGLWSVMENGLENDFKGHLQEMGNKFNVRELQEVFAREDITEENAHHFRKKLQDRVKKVDEYKRRYDAVNAEFKNPIILDGLDQNSPEFLEKYLEWRAYDSLRKDMVTSLGIIEDHSNRIVELRDEMSLGLDVRNAQEFSQFYDTNSLSSEINMLKTAIDSNKGVELDAEGKLQNENNKSRLDRLTKYKESYLKFQKELSENKISSDTKNELYENFKNLVSKDSSDTFWKNRIDASFEKLIDYTYLNAQLGEYEKYTGILSNNDSRKEVALRKAEIMKEVDSQKEKYILRSLKEFELKKESNNLLNELYAAGYFFDTKELDDLLKDGQMPSQIFNKNTNTVASLKEKIEAQEIIKKTVKKLKNMDLLEANSRDTNKTGTRASTDKRTVQKILEEYDLNLNDTVDFSKESGRNFLMALLESDYLFTAEKAIFEKLISSGITDFKIQFVNNGDRAIDLKEDGKTYVVDVRFSGSEYTVSETLGFESLIARVVTQEMISKVMASMDLNELEVMMSEVREALKETVPVQFIPYFNDPKLFLSEALNNLTLQLLLNDLQLSTAVNEETIWGDFISGVIEKLTDPEEGLNYEGKALQKITALLNKAFDGIVEAETTDEEVIEDSIEDVDAKKAEIEKRRKKELEKMAKAIFPNTTKTDIVYRGVGEVREDNLREGTSDDIRDWNFFFDKKDRALDYGENVISAIIDFSEVDDSVDIQYKGVSSFKSEDSAIIGEQGGNEYAVKSKKQIHILTKEELDKIDEINAKYDAELKALEESQERPKKETESLNPNENSNVSELEKLINERDTLLLDNKRLNDIITNPKTKRRERKAAEKKLLENSLKGNKIADRIDALKEKEKPANVFNDNNDTAISNKNYTFSKNIFGDNIIKIDTPWSMYPEELKLLLLETEGLDLSATKEQIKLLLTDLQSNPELQNILAEYNYKIEQLSQKVYNDLQLKKAAESKEQRRAEELLKRKENNKIKKENKKTIEDNLKNFLGENDFKLLTPKEIKSYVEKIQNSKNSLVPFTFNDIKTAVSIKKRKLEIKKLEKDLALQKVISENVNSVRIGKNRVSYINAKNKTVYVTVNVTQDLLDYLKIINPKMFTLSKEEFKKQLNQELVDYENKRKNIVKYIKSVKNVSLLNQAFMDYQTAKVLYPEVVRAINNKYQELGVGTKLVKDLSSPSMYSFKPATLKAVVKKISPKQRALNTIASYLENGNIKDPLFAKALIVEGFRFHGITLDLLKVLAEGNFDYKTRIGFTKFKSLANTRDGFVDIISGDFVRENNDGLGFVNTDEELSVLQDYIFDVISDYRSPLDAILGIAREIEDQFEDTDFGTQQEEQYTLSTAELEFLASEEGIAYTNNELSEMNEIMNTNSFKIINGQYKGKYSDITNDYEKSLYLDAVAQGIYEMSDLELMEALNKSQIELTTVPTATESEEEEDPFMAALDDMQNQAKKDVMSKTNTLEGENFVMEVWNKTKTKTSTVNINIDSAVLNPDGTYSITAKSNTRSYIAVVDKNGKVLEFTNPEDLKTAQNEDATILLDPEIHFIKDENIVDEAITSNEKIQGIIDKIKSIIESRNAGEKQSEIKDPLKPKTSFELAKEVVGNNFPRFGEAQKMFMLRSLSPEKISLVELMSLYELLKISELNDSEKAYIKKQINSRLMNNELETYVVLNNEAFVLDLLDAEKGEVILRDFSDEIFNMSLDDFLLSFEKEAKPGETIGNQKIDLVVSKAQLKYAKEAYSKFLNNFEVVEMPQEESILSIIEHVKNC